MKERLIKSADYFEISFLRRNNILKGILFGPEISVELRGDMVLFTSSLIVKLLKYCTLRLILKSEKCLCEYFTCFLVASAIKPK